MKRIMLILLATIVLMFPISNVAFATDNDEEDDVVSSGDVEYEESDIKLLARLINAEAGGESYLGQLAVGNNVINRVLDTRYPNTIRKVIFQKGQYTPTDNGLSSKYTESTYNAAVDVLVNGVRVLPYWVLNFQGKNESIHKYFRIGGHTFNYRIREDNLWRIWIDIVEEPEYFIERLSDRQLQIALESIPSYYSYDPETKTVSYKNVNTDVEYILTHQLREKNVEIDGLHTEIQKLNNELSVISENKNALESELEELKSTLENAKGLNVFVAYVVLLFMIIGILIVAIWNRAWGDLS